MKSFTKSVAQALLVVMFVFALAPITAHAYGGGMPWEGPLQRLLDSISGPVAKILGALVIVGAGLGLAFGEGGASVKKMLQIVFGLSIAFTATSFFLNFFGFSGGAHF